MPDYRWRMNAQTLRKVKAFANSAMLEWTLCRAWAQVRQRYLRQHIFQDLVKVRKLSFICQQLLGELLMLTSGCWNEFIDCQQANLSISVRLIRDVKTGWKTKMECLEQAYGLSEFTRYWFRNLNSSDYQRHYTTPGEWTMVMCVMDIIGTFRYQTRWMSKAHLVTPHRVNTRCKGIRPCIGS